MAGGYCASGQPKMTISTKNTDVGGRVLLSPASIIQSVLAVDLRHRRIDSSHTGVWFVSPATTSAYLCWQKVDGDFRTRQLRSVFTAEIKLSCRNVG